MPDLLSIHSDNFDLYVWSKNIDSSRDRLKKTLQARGRKLPISDILVSPPTSKNFSQSEVRFNRIDDKPIFFENKKYDIEFIFKENFSNNVPRVEHRLSSVEESFHYNKRTNSLRATINTGNDVGWFKFDLVYRIDGEDKRQTFSFEIHPTKMDMISDMQVMNSAIDEEFPLWRFSLAEKTQQRMQAAKKPYPDFLLLWLAQFEKLFEEFSNGLKQIVNVPHGRLLPIENIERIDKLKKKLPIKLEEQVARAIANKRFNKRIIVNKKILSVDTPENRFIKSVIATTATRLANIKNKAIKNQKQPEKQRLSESFLGKLDGWQNNIRYHQRQPLFKEVGSYSGLTRESQVLQQKLGYARVYKVWQQLKWYLELLEGDSNQSLKSVAELYEVWCFLEIRKILLDLDFIETDSIRIPLINNGVEVSLKGGMQGTFKLERDDGIRIELAHEPLFGKNGTTIKSWTTTQKPDIYLKAIFPNKEEIVWLFDAKYRINNSSDSDENSDYVPDDAINQMHRYRDALIHIEKKSDSDIAKKSRPVFGAYALYPGYYKQSETQNPYDTQIEEVGIGAFSLLPTKDGSGSIWLKNFLEEKLPRPDKYRESITDSYYVEEAPRIPYHGTKVTRYNDLVIIVNQIRSYRDATYIHSFKSGNADYYYSKEFNFESQSIEHHVIHEARYLAVVVNTPDGKRKIQFIYPIIDSKKLLRSEIRKELSGCDNSDNPDELYWLFKLGKSLKLKNMVVVDSDNGPKFKLASLEDLSNATELDQLEDKYFSVRG